MATEIKIFIAGCVGAIVLQAFFLGPNEGPNQAMISSRQRMIMAGLQVILAGYLATFVFEVDQALHAFLIGLAMDSILATSRRIALRMGQTLGTTAGPSSGEVDATH